MQVSDVSCGTQLIPHAFPALRSLTLTRTQLGDGSLFNVLAADSKPTLTSLHLARCSMDSTAVPQAAVALAQLPGLQALHLEGPDSLVPVALHLTGLTSLTIETERAARDELPIAVVTQNQGLRSLNLVYGSVTGQLLQPDLLQEVLTSCISLTQLALHNLIVYDQGMSVLLTHGTSITDLTLGRTSLTTSKAHWACCWRKLVLHQRTLPEFAYLPLKSVQHLQVGYDKQASWVQLDLPSDIPPAQLPDLVQKATTNLASCPAWAKAPPTQLLLSGHPQDLTTAQQVQLLKALAPAAGRHVSKLFLDVEMQLGQAEVDTLANLLSGSLTSLHLDSATLHDSFWRPLAQHFPNMQELCLNSGIKAAAVDVEMYLASFTSSTPRRLDIHIEAYVFDEQGCLRLKACVDAQGLDSIRLTIQPPEYYEADEFWGP
jgi:hypothetical protein